MAVQYSTVQNVIEMQTFSFNSNNLTKICAVTVQVLYTLFYIVSNFERHKLTLF